MRERPILFSAPMVRAILEGRKTQTRRVVKITHRTPGLAACLNPPFIAQQRPHTAAELCPYGQPGDRLWVREAWAYHPDFPESCQRAIYRAERGVENDVERWKPSIHMPRWASRILLEITSTRVERLAEISRDDAEAEGIGLRRVSDHDYRWIDYTDKDGGRTLGDPRHSFWSLWKFINGEASHNANPWVWVIEFRRLKP